MTRAGLRQLISGHVNLQVACEANSEPEALAMFASQEIDILLLDFP